MSKGFENPLMPHKKLRQIYIAMVQARLLWKALPSARRRISPTMGLEACLVSTSVDLGPGDLVTDALMGGVTDFLRGVPLQAVVRPSAVTKRAQAFADCGSGGRLPAISGIAERLWAAVGAAAALKSVAEIARAAAADDAPKTALGVVAVYLPGETKDALLRSVFEYAAKQELPIVFVVLPPGRSGRGGISALASKCGVPGIAVDGDDAVAIYRVAQESIGRARMGGGAALIECVPYVVEGARKTGDAVEGLKRYMLQRGVCTPAWIARTEKTFAARLEP